MIEKPEDLDPEHAARVTALLDAFRVVGCGSVCIHETAIQHLPYIVWSWGQQHGLRITTTPMVRADGDSYESWDIRLGRGNIYMFPNQMGLLSPKRDEVKAEVEKIRQEAAARIKALLADEAVRS